MGGGRGGGRAVTLAPARGTGRAPSDERGRLGLDRVLERVKRIRGSKIPTSSRRLFRHPGEKRF